jgi:hypothetical protein
MLTMAYKAKRLRQVLVAAVAGIVTAANSESQPPKRITLRGQIPILRLRTVLEISPEGLDVTRANVISAARDGSIFVGDSRESHVVALTPQGSGRRTIGRRGNGPGEFQEVHAIGWLGDTLVVTDRSSKRSRVSYFDSRSGRLVGTALETLGYTHDLFGAGSDLYAAIEAHTGPQHRTAIGTIVNAQSEWTFAPVTGKGVGTAIPGLRDSTQPQFGFGCLATKSRNMDFMDRPLNPDYGRLRALLSGPILVTAARDSFKISMIQPATQQVTVIAHRLAAVPVSDSSWVEMAQEYRSYVDKEGELICDPPVVRPAFNHVIRAITTDDMNRIWVETTETAGEFVYGLRADGTVVGRFSLPLGDKTVPWFIRGDRFYQVTVNADGLQGLRVSTISK